MKIAACIVALFGGAIGIMTGVFQVEIHSGFALFTIILSAVGALLGLSMLIPWKVAPWLLLVVAIGGAVPDSILWEGAGSFFLVTALLGIQVMRVQRRTEI